METQNQPQAHQAQITNRAINIILPVKNITDEIHVNALYKPAPGLTFKQARDFEINLERKIKEAIAELNFAGSGSATDINFITLAETLRITNHPTRKAFIAWRWRHNNHYPKAKIVMLKCHVEKNSLTRALQARAGEVAE